MKYNLEGNNEEKLEMALKYAGWYEGREKKIDNVIKYYLKYNVTLPDYAIAFFKEYYGIKRKWFLWSDCGRNKPEDFLFDFFPDCHNSHHNLEWYMNDCNDPTDDYNIIKKYLNKDAIFVALAGYYYHSRLWVCGDQKIYTTNQDWNGGPVFEWDSVLSFIQHSLKGKKFSKVEFI